MAFIGADLNPVDKFVFGMVGNIWTHIAKGLGGDLPGGLPSRTPHVALARPLLRPLKEVCRQAANREEENLRREAEAAAKAAQRRLEDAERQLRVALAELHESRQEAAAGAGVSAPE